MKFLRWTLVWFVVSDILGFINYEFKVKRGVSLGWLALPLLELLISGIICFFWEKKIKQRKTKKNEMHVSDTNSIDSDCLDNAGNQSDGEIDNTSPLTVAVVNSEIPSNEASSIENDQTRCLSNNETKMSTLLSRPLVTGLGWLLIVGGIAVNWGNISGYINEQHQKNLDTELYDNYQQTIKNYEVANSLEELNIVLNQLNSFPSDYQHISHYQDYVRARIIEMGEIPEADLSDGPATRILKSKRVLDTLKFVIENDDSADLNSMRCAQEARKILSSSYYGIKYLEGHWISTDKSLEITVSNIDEEYHADFSLFGVGMNNSYPMKAYLSEGVLYLIKNDIVVSSNFEILTINMISIEIDGIYFLLERD